MKTITKAERNVDIDMHVEVAANIISDKNMKLELELELIWLYICVFMFFNDGTHIGLFLLYAYACGCDNQCERGKRSEVLYGNMFSSRICVCVFSHYFANPV